MRRSVAPLLVLVAVAFVGASPFVLTSPYYLATMIFVGVNAVLVTGLNWIVGYAGLVSLGHAGFYGLGAYTAAILVTRAGWPALAAAGAALVVTAAIAAAIAVVSVRLRGHHLAMATLGFGVILQIVFEQFGQITGGPKGLAGIPPLSVFGWEAGTDLRSYYVVWTVVGVLTWLSSNLLSSRMGRALRAIEGDEIAARTSGIAVQRIKVVVFVLGSTLAAIAGVLNAHYVGFISPQSFGVMFSIELLVMVIVGGRGSLSGPLLGAALFTMLPEYLRAYREYDVVLFGVVLIAVLMFLPRGIAGAARQLVAVRRRAPAGGVTVRTTA